MLCKFTVNNYKSIRDEITLDMQAATISEHEDRIIINKDGEKFLPVSVIYGPNGGGKSNVLEALHALSTKILSPLNVTSDKIYYEEVKMSVVPFVFEEESKGSPTEFQTFFRTRLAEYRYILHIKEKTVVYESLDLVKM